MHISKSKKEIFIGVSLLLFLFVGVQTATAATIRIEAGNEEKPINKYFNADILVDTEGQEINAFAGSISYPNDILKLEDIRIGGSIINLWIEEPQAIGNQVKFSGIVPGGYMGDDGFLMKIIFKSENSGEGYITLDDFQLLADDGLGTELKYELSDFHFVVSEGAPIEPVKVGIKDLERPEAFQPIITKIPDIAGDKYVLLFFTSDKNSGMDYFEVKEGFGFYRKVKSPHILKNQDLDVDIYIRAVDKAGNIRLEKIVAPHTSPWYKKIDIYVIIPIVILILILFYLSRRISIKWRKSKQK